MSSDRDVTRTVRSWLEEGATSLPDRVLDEVLDQLPATRQRRAWWPAWRIQQMGNPFKIALAAAAIGVLAVVSILPRSPDIGAAPAPSPSPIALTTGTELEAGTTYFMDNAGGFFEGSPRLILTVPGSGWSTAGVFNVGKDYPGGSSPHDIAMTPWGPRNLVDDPCLGQAAGELDPPVGPTVEDLVAGLVEQSGGTASAPTDVTVGGYPGKRLELPSLCDGREFQRWMEGSEHGPYFYGEGQRNIVYVIDVEGLRMVIDTMYVPGVSDEDLAELDALVASMRIEPQDPGATASPTPSS